MRLPKVVPQSWPLLVRCQPVENWWARLITVSLLLGFGSAVPLGGQTGAAPSLPAISSPTESELAEPAERAIANLSELESAVLGAYGGTVGLPTVQSLMRRGRVENVENRTFTFLLLQRRPDRVRVERVVGELGQVQAVAGTTGWTLDTSRRPAADEAPPGAVPLPAAEALALARQWALEPAAINFRAKQGQATFVGPEGEAGSQQVGIRVTFADGATLTQWYDLRRFYLRRQEYLPRPGGQMTVVMFDGYKVEGGLPVAYQWVVRVDQLLVERVAIEMASANAGLLPVLFSPPTRAAAAPQPNSAP